MKCCRIPAPLRREFPIVTILFLSVFRLIDLNPQMPKLSTPACSNARAIKTPHELITPGRDDILPHVVITDPLSFTPGNTVKRRLRLRSQLKR
jgi:hypothetical protein